MQLNKMHHNLSSSWLIRGQNYEHEFGSSVLSTCTLLRHLLHSHKPQNPHITWNKLIQDKDQKPLLIDYVKHIAASDTIYDNLLMNSLDAMHNIQKFSDEEISLIIAYANNIKSNDVNQLLSVVEDLNNVLGTESDNIIKNLIQQDTNLKITTFGFRLLTYLQNNLHIEFTSFHLDNHRFREAELSKIILDRKHDTVHLSDLLSGPLPQSHTQDYCFISANRQTKISLPDTLIDTAQQLVSEIANNKSPLFLNDLTSKVPDSDLFIAHIILALKLIKPSGQVFLNIRFKTWQMNQLNPLRRYLSENGLVEMITFIKTSRVDPWILICLSYNPTNKTHIFMLGENFYNSGGLKYRLNNLTTTRIIKVLKEQIAIPNISGMVSLDNIRSLNYSLDPNVCLNFNSVSNNQNFSNYTLSSLCTKIFRGPGVYNNEISKSPANVGYYMLGHTALTENGLDSSHLTPIPEQLYKEHQTNYAVYPGDIVMLSRATTNRVVLIPDGEAYYLANINLLVLRPDITRVNPVYLYLLLSSKNGKSLLASIEKGTTLKSISIKDLKNLSLNILPLDKQKVIADNYINELAQFNLAKTKFRQFMDKCQDYLLP
jgi:hypothetical protein